MISRLLGLILLLFLLGYYVPDRKQSFSVFATTEILHVDTIEDPGAEWELPEIQLCLRGQTANGSDRLFEWCDPSRYAASIGHNEIIRWTDGYSLTVQSFEQGYIEIFVDRSEEAAPVWLSGNREMTKGSIIRVPVKQDGVRALLPLKGYVTIGDVPNTSDSLVLLKGRYEVHQDLGLFTSKSSVVERGTFFPGDRISFVENPGRPWVWQAAATGPETADNIPARIFVTKFDPAGNGLDLAATTQAEFSRLCRTRIGSQPACVQVSWMQRLGADLAPVALATILGLIGGLVALVNAYVATRPDSKS